MVLINIQICISLYNVMKHELNSEIRIALNRIDSLIERAVVMLPRIKEGRSLPQGYEFHDSELKNLDNDLKDLVRKLLKKSQISEDTWIAPVDFAYKHKITSRWSWLKHFIDGLNLSKSFLKNFISEDSGDTIYNIKNSSGVFIKSENINLSNVEIVNNLNDEKMATLAIELSLLRMEMKKFTTTPEQDIEIATIANAEIAAKQEDKQKLISILKNAGKWTLDVATKIGVSLATEVLKKSIVQ